MIGVKQYIAQLTLVVRDYDEAIKFYTEKLSFQLVEDTRISEEKRWVVIAPPGAKECRLLLAKAVGEAQRAAIGNQTGGRVFLFLFTDDLWRDYHAMTANGVRFTAPPRNEAYGTVVVFEDLYGNLWDLIQPADSRV